MKEAQVVEPSQAIAVRSTQEVGPALSPSEIKSPITAAQAKVEAVANLTMKAYEMASTLKLTPEEVSSLQAEFPDEAFKPGAAGKENLIYIEHAYLRDRLNQVFGPGQWAIIPRNRWAEPFTTQKGTEGSRVYVEAMLVIRGAFVAEAVGAMEYYPKNESQNYGDAVEGAKTAALRRCAKELGIGLQAWKKDWCDGWWKRKKSSNFGSGAKTGYQGSTQPPKAAPTPKPVTRTATPAPASPKTITPQQAIFADVQTRERLIVQLQDTLDLATEFFQKAGCILETDNLKDLPLRFVPVTRRQFQALQGALTGFGNGEEALLPYPPNPEAAPPPVERKAPKAEQKAPPVEQKPAKVEQRISPGDEWRFFPMPWGKQAGVMLAKLDKNYLFGLWANYEVEREYKGKPKKSETIAKDETFRAMLDMAGAHYQFAVSDDTQDQAF